MSTTPFHAMRGVMPRGAEQIGNDVRAQFEAVTSKHPIDDELKRRFVGNRRRVARSHALAGLEARRRALEDLAVLGAESKAAWVAPVPGGVGYGMFYVEPFKEDFIAGTAIYWEIVCPPTAGGNVSDYLYITATNRSALGVEAFISYHAQSPPQFAVFDWALVRLQKDPWALNIPFDALSQYFQTVSAHGSDFTVLPVRNSTFAIEANLWVNEVSLLNSQSNQWDSVYQFEYTAFPAEQHRAWVGSWGPIVETFEPRYQDTNAMGALNTQLAEATNGAWENWAPLDVSSAQLRADNTGLLPVFLDPNASWVVSS